MPSVERSEGHGWRTVEDREVTELVGHAAAFHALYGPRAAERLKEALLKVLP